MAFAWIYLHPVIWKPFSEIFSNLFKGFYSFISSQERHAIICVTSKVGCFQNYEDAMDIDIEQKWAEDRALLYPW